MKFKEWDRVVVNYPEFKAVNEKGTVLEVDEYDCSIRLDVCDIKGRHDCNGLCEDGYGLWVPKECLTLITNKEQTA